MRSNALTQAMLWKKSRVSTSGSPLCTTLICVPPSCSSKVTSTSVDVVIPLASLPVEAVTSRCGRSITRNTCVSRKQLIAVGSPHGGLFTANPKVDLDLDYAGLLIEDAEGEVDLEIVEAALPEALVERDPLHGVIQPFGAESHLTRTSDLLSGDEPGALQHLHVLLQAGERHAGRLAGD